MDSINNLIDDVSSVEWSFPMTIKLIVIFSVVILLSAGYYLYSENDIISSWGRAPVWLYVIIIVNLLNIAGVIIYSNIRTIPTGKRGIRGKSGKKGKQGK